MKKFIAMGAFLLLCAAPALAQEPSEAAPDTETRPAHYEAPVYDTPAKAEAGLKDTIASINSIFGQDGGIEPGELETIHEKTYSLEAAVTAFRAAQTYASARLNALDEAVQALHYASETQDAAKTRESLLLLMSAAEALPTKVTESAPAAATTESEFTIVIKDHVFSPATLTVPAGKKIKLIVDNQDPTPEEFESHDLNREKIIAGNTKATIFIGPLEPGSYHFFGEFNMATAKGDIIAQ